MTEARLGIGKVQVALIIFPIINFALAPPLFASCSSLLLLADEDQVNENAEHHHSCNHPRQMLRIKQTSQWKRPRWDETMTATMIEGGKRIATDGTGF